MAHFQNWDPLFIRACICGANGNISTLDEDYALSVFRAAGRCNAGRIEMKVDLSRCRYHPIERRNEHDDTDIEAYLDDFEARCTEELESSRLGG